MILKIAKDIKHVLCTLYMHCIKTSNKVQALYVH